MGMTYTRVPQARRAKRGYRVTFYQGGQMHTAYYPWSHYDLACDYLQRAGIDPLNDAGEVVINFTEAELQALMAHDAAANRYETGDSQDDSGADFMRRIGLKD